MNKDELHDFAYFVAMLTNAAHEHKSASGEVRHWPAIAADAVLLRTLARGIRARGVTRCNYPMSDQDEARHERDDDRAYARAREIAAHYAFDVEPIQDVRGAALKLISNNGQTRYAVPE